MSADVQSAANTKRQHQLILSCKSTLHVFSILLLCSLRVLCCTARNRHLSDDDIVAYLIEISLHSLSKIYSFDYSLQVYDPDLPSPRVFLLVANYKEALNRTIAMHISAEVRIKVKDRIYHCFYPKHGHYDGIGKQLWFFLERLSIDQWKKMEERLRNEVTWYVNLSHNSVTCLTI